MKFIQGTCLNAVLAGCQTSIFPLSPEEAIDIFQHLFHTSCKTLYLS